MEFARIKNGIGFYRKLLTRRMHRTNWCNLRSTRPVSRDFGFNRGLPVGRYYIEKFLEEHQAHIKGRVLEVSEDRYIQKYGREILSADILHFSHKNPKATLVGDLTDPKTLPQNGFDCFVCTQTLNFIYDFHEAIKGIHYVLAEGGIVLTTLAGLMPISQYDMRRWGDFWRFTTLSAHNAFADVFGKNNVDVGFFGNVLASVAVLEGISSEELTREELDFKDEDYQIIITVVATK